VRILLDTQVTTPPSGQPDRPTFCVWCSHLCRPENSDVFTHTTRAAAKAGKSNEHAFRGALTSPRTAARNEECGGVRCRIVSERTAPRCPPSAGPDCRGSRRAVAAQVPARQVVWSPLLTSLSPVTLLTARQEAGSRRHTIGPRAAVGAGTLVANNSPVPARLARNTADSTCREC